MDFAPPVPPVIEGTSLTERLLAAQADDLMLQVCCTLHQKISINVRPVRKPQTLVVFVLYFCPTE